MSGLVPRALSYPRGPRGALSRAGSRGVTGRGLCPTLSLAVPTPMVPALAPSPPPPRPPGPGILMHIWPCQPRGHRGQQMAPLGTALATSVLTYLVRLGPALPRPQRRPSGRWPWEAWSGPGPTVPAILGHGSGGDPGASGLPLRHGHSDGQCSGQAADGSSG